MTEWFEYLFNEPGFIGALFGSLVTGGTAIFIMYKQNNREDKREKEKYLKFHSHISKHLNGLNIVLEDIEVFLGRSTEIFQEENKHPDFIDFFTGFNDFILNTSEEFKKIPEDYIPINLFFLYKDLDYEINKLVLDIRIYNDVNSYKENCRIMIEEEIEKIRGILKSIDDNTSKMYKGFTELK